MSFLFSGLILPKLTAGALFFTPPVAPVEMFHSQTLQTRNVIEANASGAAKKQRKKGKWGGRKLRRAKI